MTAVVLMFILVSCGNPKTDKYAGIYKLESYESSISDQELGFKLIESYEIILDSKSRATEKYHLGNMDKLETRESLFFVDEDNNQISFRYVLNIFENFTETWEFDGMTIIMRNVDVAIVDKPEYDNKNHYTKTTITFAKQ